MSLTATGFTTQTLEDIRDALNQELRDAFGASLDLSDDSVLGQLVGIMAERYATLWELAEELYTSSDPDAATGAALDALCALTGTLRRAAAPSTVTLTLTGTDATVVPEGSRASTASTSIEFATLADATITALAAWAISTAYAVGDRVANGGDAWECTVAGTSAGAGGPDSTGLAQGDTTTDNTVTWVFLGSGDAAVDVEAESVDTGAIVATSEDITEIETPVAGWSAVINLLDADLGRDEETDAALRVRRELELAAAGTAPVNAIRADILAVTDVDACTVFNNPTDTTDADGVPPHSVEVLVQGGTDQDIWDALFDAVAAGIGTHGTESGTVTDTAGNDHTVKFSRPTEIPIYIEVTLEYDADTYEGDAAVKEAIATAGDSGTTGLDVVASRVTSWVFGVDGVLDVSAVLIGTSNPPVTSTTIAISLRELATFDTSRITITSAAGTP